MKRIYLIVTLAALVIAASAPATEVSAQQTRKEARAINRAMNARPTRDARREARQLAKEGWKEAPGNPMLVRQLDRSYRMQYETDELGYGKYIIGEAQSVAQHFDAGTMQANELAKQNLAGKIQTEVTAIVNNMISNNQLSPEEATSVTKTLSESMNVVSASLGRVIPVVTIYRDLPNRNKEVRIVVAYNAQMAWQDAQNAMRRELENEGNEKLSGILRQVFNTKFGLE